jgi:DNA-binding NtrC family response regulator
VLEAEGYAVATAGSVGEARAVIGEKSPSLVLCDVRLPDGPPFALLDALAAARLACLAA